MKPKILVSFSLSLSLMLLAFMALLIPMSKGWWDESGSEIILVENTLSPDSSGDIYGHFEAEDGSQNAWGESFRSVSGSYNITKASFCLSKVESPTANLTANLYLASEDLPTGNVLSVSTPIDSSSLTTSPTWYNFTFSPSYMIMNDTWYCMVVQPTADGIIDLTNMVCVHIVFSNVIEGMLFDMEDGGWWLQPDYDALIQIYAQHQHELYAVTFKYSSDGSFLVNGTSTSNNTVTTYNVSDVLNLAYVPADNYYFVNFTWDLGSSTLNNTAVTVTQNLTIWCNFQHAVSKSWHHAYWTFDLLTRAWNSQFWSFDLTAKGWNRQFWTFDFATRSWNRQFWSFDLGGRWHFQTWTFHLLPLPLAGIPSSEGALLLMGLCMGILFGLGFFGIAAKKRARKREGSREDYVLIGED